MSWMVTECAASVVEARRLSLNDFNGMVPLLNTLVDLSYLTNTRDLSTNKFIGEITGLPTSLIHLCVPPSSHFSPPATASHIGLNRLSQLCSCTCVTLFLPPLLPGSPSPSPLPPRSSPSAPPFLLSAPPYPPPPSPGACSITSSQGPSLPTSPPSPSSPTCACASPAPHASAHATSNHPSSPLYILHAKPPLRLTPQTPDPKLCRCAPPTGPLPSSCPWQQHEVQPILRCPPACPGQSRQPGDPVSLSVPALPCSPLPALLSSHHLCSPCSVCLSCSFSPPPSPPLVNPPTPLHPHLPSPPHSPSQKFLPSPLIKSQSQLPPSPSLPSPSSTPTPLSSLPSPRFPLPTRLSPLPHPPTAT
ncbi:unnamed protein product [Closterium sp. Naga37s-1]|nr:unnamed protein product [Closterium sp. Naga37s-1]